MPSDVPAPVGSLVSLRRFGAALHARRTADGASLAALGRRSGGWWLPDELVEIERGHQALDDASVVALARIYGLPPRSLPDATDARWVLDRTATSPTPGSSLLAADDLVARCVAVAALLGLGAAQMAPATDLVSEATSLPAGAVAAALNAPVDRGVLDALASRVVVPAVGVLVGDTSAGSLVVVRRSAPRAAAGSAPGAAALRRLVVA